MQDKTVLINSMNNLIKYHIPTYTAISPSAVKINNKCLEVQLVKIFRKYFLIYKIHFLVQYIGYSRIKNNNCKIINLITLQQLKYKTEILLIDGYSILHQFACTSILYNVQVILNNNIFKIISKYGKKQQQLFTILKYHSKITQVGIKQPLLWFVNIKKQKLIMQYIQRQQLTLISNFTSNKNVNFDPIDCIFGICIYGGSVEQQVDYRIQTSSPIVSQSNRNKDNNRNVDIDPFHASNNNSKQIYQHSYHLPISAKTTSFIKQNNTKIGNYSYHGIYTPSNTQIKPTISKPIKNQQNILNTSANLPSHIQNSPTSTTNIQFQYKNLINNIKQNQLIKSHEKQKQKQKFNNRLSLQFNNARPYKKNNTIDYQLGNNQINMLRMQNNNYINHTLSTQYQQHHGIKIMTPRQSLRNTQKISIVNNNGSYTERAINDNQREVFLREKEKFNQFGSELNGSNQKIKTIYLGKGAKTGAQTARQKKNIVIQRM